MPRDTDTPRINLGEVLEHRIRQFFSNVAVHLVPLGPRGFGGVDVKAGARAKVPVFIFALNL